MSQTTNGDDRALKPVQVSLEFAFDTETNCLTAMIKAADSSRIIDMNTLTAMLEQHGYQDFFFASGALQNLLVEIQAGKPKEVVVGERRDAGIAIDVSDDAMRVVASTEPAYGGQALTFEAVADALTAAGVTHACWNREAMAELVAQPKATHFVIASGKPAEAGTDCKFTSLIQGIITHQPRQLQNGNVDQYDFLEFTVAEPGMLLMRREPATDGVDGIDVYGNVLPATPGKPRDWSGNMPGTMLDDADENLLLASTKGHPVVMSNGVRLDDVLKLSSADGRTGNISFDGTVYIAGDAASGICLDATGDVFIKGAVEDATITAGGDIVIGGGIINANANGDNATLATRLQAGGDIHARFVTGASLIAQRNVVVKEYIGFCETFAHEQVQVGQSGGKGRIYGGRCHGQGGVLANQFGTKSSASTLISAGHVETPSEDQSELNGALASLDEQRKKVRFLMENLQCEIPLPNPDAEANTEETSSQTPDAETCNKLFNTLVLLEEQQEHMRLALADLQERNSAIEDVSIIATKRIRAGVCMRINGVQRNFKARDAGGTFKLREGAVVRYE